MARVSKAQTYLLCRISRLHPWRIRTLFCCRTADRYSYRHQSRLFVLSNRWLVDARVLDRELASGAILLSTMPQMVFRNLVVSQPVREKMRTLRTAKMGHLRRDSSGCATIKLSAALLQA